MSLSDTEIPHLADGNTLAIFPQNIIVAKRANWKLIYLHPNFNYVIVTPWASTALKPRPDQQNGGSFLFTPQLKISFLMKSIVVALWTLLMRSCSLRLEDKISGPQR
jgi:hypothetical protein